MLICRKKEGKLSIVMNADKQADVIKEAYETTEGIIERLVNINAEITIPDVENIFISEYYSVANEKKIDFGSALSFGIDTLEDCVNNVKTYFSEYDISERRSGWWSGLYKKKWEM